MSNAVEISGGGRSGAGPGARRGRPRPNRRGGRGGAKAPRSSSTDRTAPAAPSPPEISDSVRFAGLNDVERLSAVWPSQRPIIASNPISVIDPTPAFDAAEIYNPLVAAAQRNAIGALEYLLNNGAEIDAIGHIGLTAIAAATIAGHIDAAMYLLGRGASVIRAGRTGMSALHIAAAYDRSALVAAFASQPGVDINLLDEKDMTPLHHAALTMSFSTISKLLEHGAAITHDKRGFSPLFYAYEKFEQRNKPHQKKGKGKQSSSPPDSNGVDCVVALANSCPFIYETFRTVMDRNLREAIVRRFGAERIMAVLSLRIEAQEDAESFNEILLTLSRTLKADKKPMLIPLPHLRLVLSSMVTEASVNTLQSFGSLLTQGYMLPHLTIDFVEQIASALQIACRMCTFGHQPFVDYSVDFLFHMTPVFLRLICGLATKYPVEKVNEFAARFNHYWDMLQECLEDIDFNIQESERFAALIFGFYHFTQVLPLDGESAQRLRSFSSPIDGADMTGDLSDEDGIIRDSSQRPRSRRRNQDGGPGMPKLSWFLDKRPVSDRFQLFYDARAQAIRHIAEDCDDMFFKYFKYSLRVGGLVGKAHYIQSMASRAQVDVKPVSINRFMMSGTQADNGDAYEHFVQQMMALPARAYTISLQIDFLNEPGIGEGPLRELIQIASKRIFDLERPDPGTHLFRISPSGSAYHLARLPHQADPRQSEHLNLHWEMAGRMSALSITTMFPLGMRLSDPLLCRMLDVPVTSVAGYDDELQKRLDWLRDNQLDSLDLDLRWTATDELRGIDVPLCPGGETRVVTDANKHEFITALVEYRLWGTPTHKAITSSFVKGFQDVIPRQCLPLLSPLELGHLLQGSQNLDMEWMRTKLVTYTYGYTLESPVVVWFWQYFESLSSEKKAQLLQFWSGSPVLPLPQSPYTDPWSITPHLRAISSLPSSATCTRQLSIPRYGSYEQLAKKFDTVLELGYIGYSNT